MIRPIRLASRAKRCPLASTATSIAIYRRDGALLDQRIAECREERLKDLASAHQEAMRMHRMRRALARGRSVGQLIAFEQHVFGESPAENTRCQQPGNAGAEHDGSSIIRYKRCRRWAPRRDDPSSAVGAQRAL